ncbi:MAG: hypothetical protein AAB955_01250 [Patescibacteria group bacterium]
MERLVFDERTNTRNCYCRGGKHYYSAEIESGAVEPNNCPDYPNC